MNCEEVKEQIELYVLDELSTIERIKVEAHLTDCATCSAIDAEYRQVVTNLKRSARLRSPDAGFERDILLSVEEEIRRMTQQIPARRAVHFGRIAVAAAACLFVGLILRQLWIDVDTDTTSDSVGRPAAVQASIPSYSISADARSVPASPLGPGSADNIVVQGHYIYLLIDDGLGPNVAAIDSLTGRQKWRSDVESFGHITVDRMRLFCLAPGQKGGLDLVGINIVDGSTIWRYPQETSDPLHGMCEPTVLPMERICWTTNTTIHVLRSTDGEILWTRTIPGESLLSAAAAVGDDLYVAGISGLYCLDILSGEQLWHREYDFKVSRWVRPLVAACSEGICVGLRIPMGQSEVFCMNVTDRRTIWTKTVSGVSDLCIAGNRLFLRSQGVQALDMTGGKSLWSFASTGCSPLTHADGRIWFVDSTDQGHLFALYERTGEKMLDLSGIRSCNAFVERDGKGYVKTHDGAIHVVLLTGRDNEA